MSQSSLQTQCPKCETRFRVTDEQLSVARGKVRCGNCMSIFNAIEHQVMPSHAAPKAPAETESAENPARFSSEEEFVFADNPDEDASEGHYTGRSQTFSEDELSDSFLSIDQPSSSTFKDADVDEPNQNIDESWAEAMLDEIGDSEPAPPTKPATAAPKAEPRAPTEPTPRQSAPEPRTTGTSSQTSSQQAPSQQAPKERPSPVGTPPTETSFELADDTPAFRATGQEDRVGEPMSASVPFGDLRRDPVSVPRNGGGRLRTFFWSLVVLALIGVLVAQVTWFQFDRLSAIPELRPFYEKGCELAGCELKPLVNVAAIQSRKLVVKTNPENRSQLLVDAVIINRANFEQPFPAIALTFSNLNGDVVAQSIFTPGEYLAGEGQALEAMPTNTPVRIAINIRDPGKDAVNYNINFRPYTP
ncbi:zinc-ribbon domain-containing protein [Marinobacter salinisoli]|uniref:Zinc-ribbon domain-containing protein n=1 Tax=Marinobacter salinisoli TaxID=2769486 RepID=A0ABX7MS31_9GAMM|nr:DUF3426 domain-containing protein [Marinobacter salinisoli]QSP95167.1 zinc-ribbon domain-containing protein [Marinobacter salinisoli]